MFQTKSQLRKEFLARRGALAPSVLAEKSMNIVAHIVSSGKFQSANTISCYYPFRNEVKLLLLIKLAEHKKVVFPRVVKGTEKLDFYIVQSLNDFEKGVFGLMEPIPSIPKIGIEVIDLFLVPGLAFTKSGLRLGYGGGYYDETLKYRKTGSTAFGICFDLQITENIPSEIWDIKIDSIVTESGILKTVDS